MGATDLLKVHTLTTWLSAALVVSQLRSAGTLLIKTLVSGARRQWTSMIALTTVIALNLPPYFRDTIFITFISIRSAGIPVLRTHWGS